MALPEIEVRVSADTRQAEAGLGRVNERLGQVAGSAPTAQTRCNRLWWVAAQTLANVSNQTRSRIQQVSFQLQDVAVQNAGWNAHKRRDGAAVAAKWLARSGLLGAAIGVVIALGVPLAAFLLGGARNGRSMAQVMDALAEAVEKRRQSNSVAYRTAYLISCLSAVSIQRGRWILRRRSGKLRFTMRRRR